MAQLASVIAASIIGLIGGVYIGFELQNTANTKKDRQSKSACKDGKIGKLVKEELAKAEIDADEEEDSGDYSDEDDDDDVGIIVDSKSLNEIGGEVRMALIVRTDLGMLKGKVAAQCSHAAVALYRQMGEAVDTESYNPELLKRWQRGGQAKITLKTSGMEEIEELLMRAVSLNINNYLVVDAGRTQIAPGSATVLGLGPAPKSVLDMVTGDLKLY